MEARLSSKQPVLTSQLAAGCWLVDGTGASRLTLDSTNYLSLDLGSLLENMLLSDTNTS